MNILIVALTQVPGFWSQAHVYIANLISQNKELLRGYQMSEGVTGNTERNIQFYLSNTTAEQMGRITEAHRGTGKK